MKPYLPLGEALGKLLAQLSPASADRIYVTYGGHARELPNTDPVTRAVLQGFLASSAIKDVNNVNVRAAAASIGITVEEKKSDEPVTFNEWLHVQVFSNGKKLISAGGTFFGSPNNPRIVRLYSTPVEIPVSGTLLLLNNKDRPGIVGYLNDYKLVVVKVHGEFVWHKHDDTDDFFLVLRGHLTIKLRDRNVELDEGELFVVPRGVEHCPEADEEAHVLLIEPRGTRNTGDVGGELAAEEREI